MRTPISRIRANYRWPENALLFLLIGAISFVSRVPFLGAGYGTQPDAWRVALIARSIALTGEYSASRLPGYPIQEILCSLFWQGGPWALNGLTALFSGIASGFFALSLKTLGSNRYILGSLALSFVPVIYVNSTMSLDNIWALAFILASLYFALINRPVIAGIFLGFAIGCRITSGAMIIPLGLLLAHGRGRREAIRGLFELCLPAGIIGAAAFAPVFATYGPGFFTFHEPTGYPPVAAIIIQATVAIWGVFGFVALLAAIVLFVNPSKLRSLNLKTDSRAGIQLLAWLVAIALYTIAYLRLPHQSRYLIPIVPFVILVLETILPDRVFRFICIVLLFSSFIGAGRSGLRPGPIFSEYAERKQGMEATARVVSLGDAFQNKTVIVSGWWLPKIEGTLFATSRGLTDYVYLLDAAELRKRLDEGFAVYYLPGIREYNNQALGIDLAKFGAKPLLPDEAM